MIMAVIRIMVQITDNLFTCREKVHRHIIISIQSFGNITVLLEGCFQMILFQYIIPVQNTVRWEKDHKLRIRICLNIRADIGRKIGFHR